MNTEPLTAADHLALAKQELSKRTGVQADLATAHALVAIAELMATNMTNVILDATCRGAMAVTEAMGNMFSVLGGLQQAPAVDPDFECLSCGKRTTVDTPTGWRCTSCGSSDDHTTSGR